MTREEYLDHADPKAAHRMYYAQFVDSWVKTIVATNIGLDRIVDSKDEHFNDIPLRTWDMLTSILPHMCHDRLKEQGDHMTLSGGVCILKEAARQLKEEKL